MEVYARHAGDVGRPLSFTFPTGMSLTGAALRLQVSDRHGTVLLDKPMEITNQTNPAKARYVPLTGELDVLGAHDMTVEVTYLDGSVETFPSPGFARLLVERQVA